MLLIVLTDVVAELPYLHLLESTAVLWVSQHVPQVAAVTVLHTYVRCIASGGVGKTFRKILSLDEVWVVEALGQVKLPVPTLNVLLGEVEETTLLYDYTIVGDLVRQCV